MNNKNFFFHQPTEAKESWWLGADRAALNQLAQEERKRMSAGRMASFVSPLPRWLVDVRRNRPTEHISSFEREQQMVRIAEAR